jgi:DNA-binding NtrC family response regulator
VTPQPAPPLIGRAPTFLAALALVQRMARYDVPVLIEGETGTGKELAARAIHYGSARRDAPFVALNCGAVPDTLIESELFGCERGAYTDARQSRTGLVAAAEGGTLFLDELDSLPPRAQVALLRFLQDCTYRSVGGTRELSGDVRVVAAASPRLRQRLDAGEFRDDLLFRLGVLMLQMPPLRERLGDARLLAEHFVARHARQHSLAAPRGLSAASLRWLETHPWPGNVRELDNCVQRALLLGDGDGPLLELLPRPAHAPPTAWAA